MAVFNCGHTLDRVLFELCVVFFELKCVFVFRFSAWTETEVRKSRLMSNGSLCFNEWDWRTNDSNCQNIKITMTFAKNTYAHDRKIFVLFSNAKA